MYEAHHNVLPDHIRQAALASFPAEDWRWWHRYPNGKLATVDPSRIPEACRVALQMLATTIAPPAGFWDFDLYGAGMHLMPPGVALGLHTDATHHPQKPWRRLSSLVYFLDDCTGGELVVADQYIAPRANMAAAFRANQLHEVLTTQSDRRTLSLFAWAIDHGTKGNTSANFLPATPRI